jgi:hypothetical protein
MSQMGSHGPFRFLKHKLWPKEGLGIKLSIWLSTTKSWESPWFLCLQVACNIPLKISWRGLQLGLDFISIRGLQKKLWAPKVMGIQILRILGLQLGSPRTKWHLCAGPMAMYREYYKGKGVIFPQVQAVVNLMSSCLFVVCPCTKSGLAMHYPTCCLVYASLCE